MKALKRFAKELAEQIFERVDATSFIGQRLIVTDYPQELLEMAADILADMAANAAPAKLDPENVIFVISEPEYRNLAERQKSHSAHQVGLSYTENVRESGKTAIFFIRRDLMPFMPESVKEKGSVLLTSLGLRPTVILKQLLKEWFNEVDWFSEDCHHLERILDLTYERCKQLLMDERREDLCFSLMDRFFSCPKDVALGSAGYCALGLVPAVDNPQASVRINTNEIDRLRAALADPSKKKGYLREHREFDQNATQALEDFLDEQGWRVPLETVNSGRDYNKFFWEWPECCDLSYLQCAETGGALIDSFTIKGNSGRSFECLGSLIVIVEQEMLFTWKAVLLDGCSGEILLDGSSKKQISSLDTEKLGPISADELGIPFDRICELSVLPTTSRDRRRLQRRGTKSLNIIRLDPKNERALLLFGRNQPFVIKASDEVDISIRVVSPPSGSLAIAAEVYKGTKHTGSAIVRDQDTGDHLTRVQLEDGTPTFLEVNWEGKSEPAVLEALSTDSSNDEPSRVDSLIEAVLDASKNLDRISGAAATFEEEWDTFPHFTILCPGISDFARQYEARRSWTHELSKKMLETPSLLGPRAVLISGDTAEIAPEVLDTKDGLAWPEIPDTIETARLLDSRRQLFEAFGNKEQPLPFLRLSDFQTEIYDYCEAYYAVLQTLRSSENRYSPPISRLSLIDTFFAVVSPTLADNGKVTDQELDDGIFILAPTHPIRLLWLLRREEFVFQLAESSDKSESLELARTLDALGFPAMLALPDGRVFYDASNFERGFWGAYISEGMSLQKTTTALSRLLGSTRNRFDSPVVPTAEKILSALDYSHRLLPYRDTLRIGYSNPGSAQALKDAFSRIPKSQKSSTGLHHFFFNQMRTRFRTFLIGSGEGENGKAFVEAIEEGARDTLPLRLEIQSVESEVGQVGLCDLTFADDIAGRTTHALVHLERCLPILPICGLICPLICRSRLQEDATGELLFAYAHPPPNDIFEQKSISPADKAGFALKLNHLYQTLFREPREGEQFDDNSARAFKVEYRQDTLDRVRHHQKRTNFLFTLDTNADLAMFEKMAASGESIIIDFDTACRNPIAKLFSKGAHNYVITTRRDSPIKTKLKSELRRIFENHPSSEQLEDATERIFSALNGLSGRFLKKMLQRPTDVKEAIGCGLSTLLIRKLVREGLDRHNDLKGRSASVLIPIDDHFGRWRKLAGARGQQGEGLHADLLFVTLQLSSTSNAIEVWLRILEAKCGYENQSDISAKGYSQIRNTWETVVRWLALEPVGAEGFVAKFRPAEVPDISFRLLDLASILDFHLRRALRLAPELARGFDSDSHFEQFCNSVYAHLVQGNADFLFELNSQDPIGVNLAAGDQIIAGHLLHFEKVETEDPPRSLKGIRPIAVYRRFGSPTSRGLLIGG